MLTLSFQLLQRKSLGVILDSSSPLSFTPHLGHWQTLWTLQETENANSSHFLHGHGLGLSDHHLPEVWLISLPLSLAPAAYFHHSSQYNSFKTQGRCYHFSVQNQSMAFQLVQSESQGYCHEL